MIDFNDAPGSGDPFGPPPSGWDAAPVVLEPPAFIEALNPRQREAALCTDGPLIVLAGAGSGKTKMLTSRIAYLIEGKRVPGHHILAVTFTNKAAAEMRERVEKVLGIAAQTPGRGYGWGIPEIGTFHSVCVRILRREITATPFTKPFVIYDDSDQLSLIKGVFDKIGLDEKSVNPKAIQGAINRMKCDAIGPEEMEPAAHDLFERHCKRVYEQYQKDLFANNALDFGEILTMTYRIFRDNEAVRDKYQKRFRYIHVDEYQDTNRAQYLLLSMLASKKHGGHENICVVGDEDQSIYKWRGADIHNILDFEKDYPGAKVVKLEQNYRSTQTIIRAAGEVIKHNRERREKTLWTDNEEGLPVVRAQLPDERAEADLVISEIKRLAGHEGRSYGDFSIFYRTNAQSRQFEDVFRREKIPYQIVGGLRFYDRKEIKDILAYFKVVLNPTDSVNLKRIINTPARGIGKTTIEKLDEFLIRSNREREGLARDSWEGQQADQPTFALQDVAQLSFWDVLLRAAREPALTSAGTAKKLAAFVQLVERLIAEQPKLKLSELYHLVLDETGYVRELRQEGSEEALARIENLEEFDNVIQEFEEDHFEKALEASPGMTDEEKSARRSALLAQFIEQSSLVSDTDTLDAYTTSVKMMTLHSSKGLEFPVVFMVGMEEGLFPSVRAWEETSEEDIEEERRLCYVGMTRAREHLYLMSVAVRRFWGNVNYQEPSRFFEEIPANLIEFKDYTYGARAQRLQPPARASRDFEDGDSDWPSADEDGLRRTSQPSTSNVHAFKPRVPAFGAGPAKPGAGWVGRKMMHPEYGPGTVIAAEGSGEDEKLTIEFRGRQQRKFVRRYVAEFIE